MVVRLTRTFLKLFPAFTFFVFSRAYRVTSNRLIQFATFIFCYILNYWRIQDISKMGLLDALLDTVFSLTPQPQELPSQQEKSYPELMLHQATHATQYYSSLQQYTRQFVTQASQNQVVQFQHSQLDTTLREKVNSWDNYEFLSNSKGVSVSSKGSTTSTANSLFSWSTSDTLIAARKRQLQERSAHPQSSSVTSYVKQELKSVPESASQSSDTDSQDIKANGLPKTDKGKSRCPLVMQKLARVVERESSRFIQDRIDVIKAHHTKEVLKIIDERKRRDHEMHLRRIKRKEEEYERSLKAAIALQNMNRQSGFFGSLFGLGLKQNSSNFTLDIWDLEPQSYPPPASISPATKSPSPLPSQTKKSSFLPFWSPSKTSLKKSTPTRVRSPSSMADTSFEGSSTKSVAGSDVGDESVEQKIESSNQESEDKQKNETPDFLSSPELDQSHEFTAMKPVLASPKLATSKAATNDLLQL